MLQRHGSHLLRVYCPLQASETTALAPQAMAEIAAEGVFDLRAERQQSAHCYSPDREEFEEKRLSVRPVCSCSSRASTSGSG